MSGTPLRSPEGTAPTLGPVAPTTDDNNNTHTNTTAPTRRRSSSHSPRNRARPLPPVNPPDPPQTLLSYINSRAIYDEEAAEMVRDREGHSASSGRDREGHGREGTRGDAQDHAAGSSGDHGDPRTDGRGGKKRPWYARYARRIGRGMYDDVRARAPYYMSDWTDAWNYRVVPATWFIFFANVFPGIAFSLDLIESTGQYGVQEVLLSTFASAFIASIFGGQPLAILGVTGPITVFNKVIYEIMITSRPDPPDYLQFMGWVYLWGAILHVIAAVGDACSLLKYVTRFSCDTFGFYVAAVYVQYGIQVVERQFGQSSRTAAFLGIILAVITLVLPHYFNAVAGSGYGTRGLRRFCSDYGMPITVIAASSLAYWGFFNSAVNEESMRLPVNEVSFQAANGRAWLVRFWQLEARYVGIAFPFGLVLFILFYFDHNVSSLIAQGSDFPLRKPPGFHWDFFLLGITVFIAGLLGFPAPNGLIPQAPLHTASLVITGFEEDDNEKDDKTVVGTPTSGAGRPGHGRDGSNVPEHAIELESIDERAEASAGEGANASQKPSRRRLSHTQSLVRRLSRNLSEEEQQRKKSIKEQRAAKREVPVAVVEQRVSNLAQGCLCLVLMTKPFQHVLGLIPKGVLAGLFWYMGTDALLSSGVTEKMLFLIRDPQAISPSEPLNNVRKSRIVMFLIIELLGFGATFAITQTIAAIGFPVIIMALVPVRIWLVPRLPFTKRELDILDGPVASDFTLESVGGSI